MKKNKIQLKDDIHKRRQLKIKELLENDNYLQSVNEYNKLSVEMQNASTKAERGKLAIQKVTKLDEIHDKYSFEPYDYLQLKQLKKSYVTTRKHVF